MTINALPAGSEGAVTSNVELPWNPRQRIEITSECSGLSISIRRFKNWFHRCEQKVSIFNLWQIANTCVIVQENARFSAAETIAKKDENITDITQQLQGVLAAKNEERLELEAKITALQAQVQEQDHKVMPTAATPELSLLHSFDVEVSWWRVLPLMSARCVSHVAGRGA